jgi:sarcosine oxidase subunit beta
VEGEVVSSALPTTADIVVVGAGCIGASIAVHLAMAGIRDVLLVEKERPAAMTTGRSSAIVRQHYSQRTFARWAMESLSVWERFDDIFGVEPVFTRTGWAIAGGQADVAPMRDCVELLRGIGVRTESVLPESLANLDPSLRCDDFACASYEPDAGYCDPALATAGFVTAFERLGGLTLFGARVTGLHRENTTWCLETSLGDVRSPVIVNAAGAYARWLANQAGVQLPIEYYAHDVAVFSPGRSGGARLALYDMVGAAYYRPDGAGATVVGSINWSEGARVLDDADSFPWVANPQVVARYARAMAQRYLGTEPRLERSHAGIYFITPDRYPILGEVPQAPGLFLACGFSHGFKVSPALGKAAAARLVDGPRAAPELDEFRLARFADGELIAPLFPYVSGVQT